MLRLVLPKGSLERATLDLFEAADLGSVIQLLPAMKSPTVSKLFGEDGFAVEAVVPKHTINTLIPALKDHGATDIIELPIAKIVP